MTDFILRPYLTLTHSSQNNPHMSNDPPGSKDDKYSYTSVFLVTPHAPSNNFNYHVNLNIFLIEVPTFAKNYCYNESKLHHILIARYYNAY